MKKINLILCSLLMSICVFTQKPREMGPLPVFWDETTRVIPDNLYIWAPNSNAYDKLTTPALATLFFDKRKKHFNGK